MSRVREGLIRKLVRELIRQELDEANSTSSVGGSYNTPHAFGGSNKKGKGKGKAGYTGGHDEPTDGTGHFIAKDPKLRKTESVNEAVKEIQLKEKIFEPAKWWKSDPEELLRHVYWLKGQMAPSDKKKRAQAYKDIATQLNKKYRAPKKDFQRHFSYDESVNESSYHKRQITDFIKKNKDSEYTPTIQVKGSKSKTNYLNISFEALEQLAKIMMKESVNEGISVADERRVGKFTIVILTNGGKMRSAILSKNNDNKYNRNDKDVLKNLWDLAGKYKGQEIKESINEGRYHAWRNDDTMTPKQKIGIAMRETRDSLKELERVVRYNVKLKNELKVDSRDYWKNTHKALNKISERLVKLANKVGQLH